VNKPRIPRPVSLRQFSLSRKLPALCLPKSAARQPMRIFAKPPRSFFASLLRKR